MSAVSQLQWGDVGTWVGGLATAVGLALTATILGLQLRDRRKEQARLVSIWKSQRHVDTDSSISDQVALGFVCQNASNSPIYEVYVEAIRKQGGEWRELLRRADCSG